MLVNKRACFQLSTQVSGHDFSRAVTGSFTSVILSDAEGAYATEAESKDPDNAYSTMQHKGVLTKHAGLWHYQISHRHFTGVN